MVNLHEREGDATDDVASMLHRQTKIVSSRRSTVKWRERGVTRQWSVMGSMHGVWRSVVEFEGSPHEGSPHARFECDTVRTLLGGTEKPGRQEQYPP
jgi:hypothetical protein